MALTYQADRLARVWVALTRMPECAQAGKKNCGVAHLSNQIDAIRQRKTWKDQADHQVFGLLGPTDSSNRMAKKIWPGWQTLLLGALLLGQPLAG